MTLPVTYAQRVESTRRLEEDVDDLQRKVRGLQANPRPRDPTPQPPHDNGRTAGLNPYPRELYLERAKEVASLCLTLSTLPTV